VGTARSFLFLSLAVDGAVPAAADRCWLAARPAWLRVQAVVGSFRAVGAQSRTTATVAADSTAPPGALRNWPDTDLVLGFALEADIRAWIENWNANPRPFAWTKTADEIPDSLAKYLARISGAAY
jgi:hypothetical protein